MTRRTFLLSLPLVFAGALILFAATTYLSTGAI